MNIEPIILTVTDALKKMDLNTALTAINQIPDADHTWETLQLKGTILKFSGSFSEAIPVFESGLTLQPKDPALMTDLAESLTQTGQITEAESLLKEVLQKAPEYGDAHFQLGVLYFETAQFEAALPCFSAAAARMPKDASALTLKARTLLALNDMPQAEVCFQEALQLNPKDPEAHYFLSGLYFETGEVMKAIASLEMVLTLIPDHKAAIHTLGLTYFNLSRFQDALPFFKKERDQNPNDTEIQLQIALCLTETGDPASALRMLETLLQNIPNDISLLCAKGMAQVKAKAYKDAIETLKHAAKTDPSNATPFSYLGILFMDMTHYDDAIKAYTKAISLDPHSHGLHRALGSCFLAAQRFDEAVQALKKAEAISSESMSRLLLGRALLESGKAEESDVIFEACIQENPAITAQIAMFKTMPLS